MKLTSLFEKPCPLCGILTERNWDMPLCKDCLEKFRAELCETESDKPLTDGLDSLTYIFHYNKENTESVGRGLILKMKSPHKKELSDFVALHILSALKKAIDIDPAETIITNVPRSPDGLVREDIDNTKILAKSIADLSGIKYVELLHNQKKRRRQKTLGFIQRKKNTESAFKIKKGQENKIISKKIILLDDVITTGATMSSCALLLKKYGARYVCGAAAAKSKTEFTRKKDKSNFIDKFIGG